MKTFFRTFLFTFLLFTILGIPFQSLFHRVADTQLFGGSESLKTDMPMLVESDSPFFEAFKERNRVNVLMLGVNQGLADTIMVVSFDLDTKDVDLISLPRDTYYEREGHRGIGERKLNASFHQGVVESATAVSDLLLGMPINYYAIVEYKGIENIVDSMGGVPMNIPFRMRYNDPYDTPPLHIDIPEGQQTLNGEQAVQFLRYRKGYPEGDIGRIRAQQEFMKAAFQQMLGFDLPNVAKTVFQNVDSDITLGMTTKLATSAIGVTSSNLSTYTLPGTPADVEAISFWFADTQKTGEMIREIYAIEGSE